MKTFLSHAFRSAAVCALALWAMGPTARASLLQPQDPAGYSSRLDGPGSEEVFDSFADAAGNVYVVGRTSSVNGAVDVLRALPANPAGSGGTTANTNSGRFGPDTPLPFTGTAGTYSTRTFVYSLFVTKYDRSGKALWTRTAAGNPGDNYGGYDYVATGVAADSNGNVFVTGSVAGDATFGPFTVTLGSGAIFPSGGGGDLKANLFVAMLDRDGNWQWVKPLDIHVTETSDDGKTTYTATSNIQLYLRNGGRADNVYSNNGSAPVPAASPAARGAGTPDGHALALGPDGSIYIKGVVERGTAISQGGSYTQLYWLNVNGNTADTRPNNRVALGASYVGSGGQASVVYQDTAFLAKLKAVPATPGVAGATTTYAWDWLAPVTSGVIQGPDGSTSSASVDKGTASSQGSSVYYGNSTGAIGQLVVDDASVYLTGNWKGKNVLAGSATTSVSTQQDGFVARLNASTGLNTYLAAFTTNRPATSAYPGGLAVDDQHNAYFTAAVGNNDAGTVTTVLTRTPTDGNTNSFPLGGVTSVPFNTQSFFLAKLNASGDPQWLTAPALSINSGVLYVWATSLSRDTAGALYLGGGLYAAPATSAPNYFTLAGQDVFGAHAAGNTAFLLKVVDAGGFRSCPWALQTYAPQTSTGDPAPAFDTAGASAGLGGTVYWAVDAASSAPLAYGRSPNAADNAYDRVTGRGAFLLPVLADGGTLSPAFASFATVVCGQEIVPPAGAYRDANNRPLQPEVYVPGTNTLLDPRFTYWDAFGKRLFAVASSVAEVRWPVSATATDTTRLRATVALAWPTVAQGLVTDVSGAGAGGAGPAVSLEPASATSTFASILYTDSGATVSGVKQFNAPGEGYSVLLYSDGKGSSPASANMSLAVVRTYRWTNAAVQASATATVGTALDPASYAHNDPEGKSGYVVNARARIDANGPAAAYSFATQKGPIIPVNTEETAGTPPADTDAGDDLWVIWSHLDTRGVGWPAQAVRYTAAWPTKPERIVIASQLGSEIDGQGAATYGLGVGGYQPSYYYTASDGTFYSGEANTSLVSGGSTFTNPVTITNTPDQKLYQYGRAGTSFSYSLPLANGNYLVTLHLSEPSAGPSQPGQRTMNVSFNGTPVLTNFSTLARAGGVYNKAVPITLPVTITGGTLNIAFVAAPGAVQALTNAIKVAPAAPQERLAPAKFQNLAVYHQPDRSLPGYNPNEEHALLAPPNQPADTTASGRLACFALRNDLNNIPAGHLTSDPYVLVRYQDATDGLKTKFKVYAVVVSDFQYSFASFTGVAGTPVQPPYPLTLLPQSTRTTGSGPAFFRDRKGQVWAQAAGGLTAQYFYGLRPDFWYDTTGSGVPDTLPDNAVPWLDRYSHDVNGSVYGVPVPVNYLCTWPAVVPTLFVGDTVTSARDGLPGVEQWSSATVLFEETGGGLPPTPATSLVRVLPYADRRVVSLPGGQVNGTSLTVGTGVAQVAVGPVERDLATGFYRLSALPYALKTRVLFAPTGFPGGPALVLGGYKDAADYAGRPLLLLDILSAQERDRLLGLSGASVWTTAVTALYNLSRNPNAVDLDGRVGPDVAFYAGFVQNNDGSLRHADALGLKALTAGKAAGVGYVTLAENNAPNADPTSSVALHVIQVRQPPVVGDLKVIFSDNPLDEKITVRHGADFAGDPSDKNFEWFWQPASGPTPPPRPSASSPGTSNGWQPFTSGAGVNEITFEGAGLATLSDAWVYCRYTGYGQAATDFAGDPAGTAASPRPAFVPGWIKRVLAGLNPFEARVKNFASTPTQTYSSALTGAGTRYEGDVALNGDPANLNSLGLISLYETVLRRGLSLSIDGSGGQTNAAVNQSLLLAATRVSDLYMLLGNEAYADAQDPTVGITSATANVGSLAPSLFAFQNEVPNLISEELALMRGRDDTSGGVGAAPVYNRLYWNFTQGLEGEPTYVQNYGISDVNSDGFINAADAALLYPQGHGDAWGHYLSALKSHYRLLRSPLYTWAPNSENTVISGVAVEVDYLDERKFAAAAAARATVGAEIVNLTYRDAYTDDPAGEWQGYRDGDANRAWGVVEWARRAGQGAYFDWVTANAILPANHTALLHNPLPDTSLLTYGSSLAPAAPATTGPVAGEPAPTGLQKIDRTTVPELPKIAAAYADVQAQLDQADAGLNPLGLTPGTIPFDINPTQVSAGTATHFEQVYARTQAAIGNARAVFDYASQLTNRLRQSQLSATDFSQTVAQQDRDYNNRLIEIFGYPYAADPLYPGGYNGPDLYHYNYVPVTTVSGDSVVPDTTVNGFFKPFAQEFTAPGGVSNAASLQALYSFYLPDDAATANPVAYNAVLTVPFPQATASSWAFAAPASWGDRRAPGTAQLAIGDMVRAEAELRRALSAYELHTQSIQDQVDLLFARAGLQSDVIQVLDTQRNAVIGLNALIGTYKGISSAAKTTADIIEKTNYAVTDAIPKVVGTSDDVFAALRGGIDALSLTVVGDLKAVGAVGETAANSIELAKQEIPLDTDLSIRKDQYSFDIQEKLKAIEVLLREDVGLRIGLFNLQQSLLQAGQKYQIILGQADRLMQEQVYARKKAAGVVQLNRYQDITYRNFRNAALGKYRAAFDLAARYVYLAATTYDYETVQLGSSSAAGRQFLTDIVRERALGQYDNANNPVVGVNGLSDPLARLTQNFQVLKGRLGINNPQIEAGQFSLRQEKFRLRDTSDEAWRDQLQSLRVADLWQVPEFRRYCRPFAPEAAGPQPGLVIPFATDITFGQNFFGLPLGGGDSSYDSSNFATKLRSVGVSFTNYAALGLASTPRVYFVPVGLDVLRAPNDATLATRQFDVVDQAIPTPFPVGTSALQDPNYIPSNDSLDSPFNQIRQFSRFLAYNDTGASPTQLATDTRLIGRSVWNTRWLMIIPGGTFLNDPNAGLDTFILGKPIPGDPNGARDGKGVKDIKMLFQTYSYSGN